MLVVKGFSLDLENLELLNVKLPAELFDVVALAMLAYGAIIYYFNWASDLTAFKKWYREHEIWSQFNTNMKKDRGWYSGGLDLLKSLHEIKEKERANLLDSDVTEEVSEGYEQFVTNAELWIARLEDHQKGFDSISRLGRVYIFGFWGAFPAILTFAAFVVLLCTNNL